MISEGISGDSLLCLIKSRRSVRRFTDQDIPIQHLLVVLEAAAWAPSGGNKQPWQFLVVRERSTIQKISLFSPGLKGNPAALLIICNSTPDAATSVLGVSMAALSAMLMAHSLGLGSCAVHSFNQQAVSLLLDLPGGFVPELIISLGYAAETPKTPPRRGLEDTTHWERYGGEFDASGI